MLTFDDYYKYEYGHTLKEHYDILMKRVTTRGIDLCYQDVMKIVGVQKGTFKKDIQQRALFVYANRIFKETNGVDYDYILSQPRNKNVRLMVEWHSILDNIKSDYDILYKAVNDDKSFRVIIEGYSKQIEEFGTKPLNLSQFHTYKELQLIYQIYAELHGVTREQAKDYASNLYIIKHSNNNLKERIKLFGDYLYEFMQKCDKQNS